MQMKRRKNTKRAGKGDYFPTYLFQKRKAETKNISPPILMVMCTTKYIPLKIPGMNIAKIEDSFV